MSKEVLERALSFRARAQEVREKLREEKVKLALRAIESRYELSLEETPLGRLSQVREHLEQNPEKNLCLYFNHISYPDPVFALWLHSKHLDPEGKRDLVLPASHWHTKFRNNPHFFLAAKLGGIFFDYDLKRIVQAYMVDNPDYPYTKEDALVTYLDLCRRLRKATNTDLIISPEGHRSEEEGEALQKGEAGIGHLVRELCPVLCLPVGIVYQDDFNRDRLNFGARVNLRVAPPIFYQEIKKGDEERVVFPDLMIQLASVLPPRMRGTWADKIPGSSI